jgi:hypothetical protein
MLVPFALKADILHRLMVQVPPFAGAIARPAAAPLRQRGRTARRLP